MGLLACRGYSGWVAAVRVAVPSSFDPRSRSFSIVSLCCSPCGRFAASIAGGVITRFARRARNEDRTLFPREFCDRACPSGENHAASAVGIAQLYLERLALQPDGKPCLASG